jgi:hypothetical protein
MHLSSTLAVHGCLLLLPLCLTGCLRKYSDWGALDTTQPASSASTEGAATVLSAFFGLDNGLTKRAERLCPGAAGMDGMPVIFSTEIDTDSLQAGDFGVVTSSGAQRPVVCATFGPALDPGELRTALLAGEFGGTDDPPVSVHIRGHVLSIDGRLDFHGATAAVTPLAEGPSLVLAEVAAPDQSQGTRAIGPARGTRCPKTTKQAIRVTWAGGISKPGGGSADMQEGARYSLRLDDGAVISPNALADLEDNDNNHLLCLEDTRTVVAVSFPAGLVVDPNGDLNPSTEILVRTR